MGSYIISVDQSTQGTKALLFDERGLLLARRDAPHKQWISPEGWVSHDGEEIYGNVIRVIRELLEGTGTDPSKVAGLGITNQRETSLIWDRETGRPLEKAVVWQCARAESICERESVRSAGDLIFSRTGLTLSPYFPAAKLCWLLENVPHGLPETYCLGTVDSYLVYRLTGGRVFATDLSNASRTQLFDIYKLQWDPEICGIFGVDRRSLPEVLPSDGDFGETDCEGLFPRPIPIRGVMGDSHAALFGQNCRKPGLAKATYGTGSSIMLNIGRKPVLSKNGLVTSIAWGKDGITEYVLEGNLNYTGAVITWLKDDVGLISTPDESEALARAAVKNDSLYLVPAFTGLGTPYWKPQAKAAILGMDRTTGRNEIVRAGVECIAYQITDVIRAMEEDTGRTLERLSVDGGPTKNLYLMQFQSDVARCEVLASGWEELSGVGAAWMCGLTLGLYGEEVFENIERTVFRPEMNRETAVKKYAGWKKAAGSI